MRWGIGTHAGGPSLCVKDLGIGREGGGPKRGQGRWDLPSWAPQMSGTAWSTYSVWTMCLALWPAGNVSRHLLLLLEGGGIREASSDLVEQEEARGSHAPCRASARFNHLWGSFYHTT